jgi:anti-anti-sigma factor
VLTVARRPPGGSSPETNDVPSPDAFTLERHGDLTLVAATPALETLDPGMEQQVAEIIINCLRGQEAPLVLFDLSQVNFFGSIFLAVLLRCWKLTTSRGGSMALAGVSAHARELLRITSLDMIFPIYPDRREAMEALLSD